VFFFIWIVGGGVQLGPLGRSATNCRIVSAPGDYEDGEFGWMMIGKGNWSTQRKPYPVPLCPKQIPLMYVLFFLSCIFIIWKLMYKLHFWEISSLHLLFVVFSLMAICQCCILMLGQFSASLRGRCCSVVFEAHRKKLEYLTNFSVTEFRDLTLPTWKPLRYTPYLSRFNAAADSHKTHFPNKYFIIVLPFQYLYSNNL
jgi:hypothetical protein